MEIEQLSDLGEGAFCSASPYVAPSVPQAFPPEFHRQTSPSPRPSFVSSGHYQRTGKRGAKPCLPNFFISGAAGPSPWLRAFVASIDKSLSIDRPAADRFSPLSASFGPPVSHPFTFRHQAGGLRCGSTCGNTVPLPVWCGGSRAIPAKVRSDFASGIAAKETNFGKTLRFHVQISRFPGTPAPPRLHDRRPAGGTSEEDKRSGKGVGEKDYRNTGNVKR